MDEPVPVDEFILAMIRDRSPRGAKAPATCGGRTELPGIRNSSLRMSRHATLQPPKFLKMQRPALSSQIFFAIAMAVNLISLRWWSRHGTSGRSDVGGNHRPIFMAPCTQVAILAGGRRIDLTLRLAEQTAEQAALKKSPEIRALRITAAERTAHRIAPLAAYGSRR